MRVPEYVIGAAVAIVALVFVVMHVVERIEEGKAFEGVKRSPRNAMTEIINDSDDRRVAKAR